MWQTVETDPLRCISGPRFIAARRRIEEYQHLAIRLRNRGPSPGLSVGVPNTRWCCAWWGGGLGERSESADVSEANRFVRESRAPARTSVGFPTHADVVFGFMTSFTECTGTSFTLRGARKLQVMLKRDGQGRMDAYGIRWTIRLGPDTLSRAGCTRDRGSGRKTLL